MFFNRFRIISQSILINEFGYSTESVYIDLSERSIDLIEESTFYGFNRLEVLHLEDSKLLNVTY